jgi:hypothetical protein
MWTVTFPSIVNQIQLQDFSLVRQNTSYSPLEVNLCFGGIFHLYLQGLRLDQAKNRREAGGDLDFLSVGW